MAEVSVMSRLNKTSIRVTDIANQFWCERQMELNCLHGTKFTKEMAKGRSIHAELKDEVYVPLTVETVTYKDYLYKAAYENVMSLHSLKADGMCREVRVFGSINGYKVSGQIDEMRIKDGKVQVVERKTTQAGRQITGSYSKTHAVQVMVYRKLMEDIRSKRYAYENFAINYGVGPGKDGLSEEFKRGLDAIGIHGITQSTYEMYKKMFSEIYTMPELSNDLEIAYVDRASGKQIGSLDIPYTEEAVNKDLTWAMGFWLGKRESQPVPESEVRKCGFCKFFGKECTVWGGQKTIGGGYAKGN
ncbi:Exonuclease V - a 5' deoxyribonuclease [uncultured archaeon]|nr:Exonuclease V - a 5' deoxyribonuclease [uncultured archaeon]